MKKSWPILGVLLLLSTYIVPLARAADYPDKPVRIISPFSAGGTNDYLARLAAKILTDNLNSSFLVEQRMGAGGMIGADLVAKAPPDGSTLLMGSISTHAVAPFVYAKLPFDYKRDFTPITIVANVPMVLVVSPKVQANSVEQLLSMLKARPGSMTYGSAGNGTVPHLAGELFRTVTGTKIVHVPYRGESNAINDLLGGQIDMMFANLPAAISHIKAGTLRALAVSSSKRSAGLPDVPTVAETGVNGFVVDGWYGLFGPGGMDPAVTEKIAGTIRKGLSDPSAKKLVQGQGAEAVGNTPREFATFLSSEQGKWSQVIKQANITAQ